MSYRQSIWFVNKQHAKFIVKKHLLIFNYLLLQEIFINPDLENANMSSLELLLTAITKKENFSTHQLFTNAHYKTYFRILYKANKKVIFRDILKGLKINVKVYAISGIFTSEYALIASRQELYDICVQCLDETSVLYTKYYVNSLKNLIYFFRIFTEVQIDCISIWRRIYKSLEVPYAGIRENSLILIECLIVRDEIFSQHLYMEVTDNWSWTNRYKYYILAVIFSNYPIENFAEEEREKILLMSGIKISLNYKNLLSPSQSLIKEALVQQSAPSRIIDKDTFADLIKNSSSFEFENLINQWMIHVKNFKEIYEKLELYFPYELLVESEKYKYLQNDNYERLVYLRNVLKAEFRSHIDVKLIDSFLITKTESLSDIGKAHLMEIIYNTLTKDIHEDFEENLKCLKTFIINCYATNCPALRHIILKKLSMILDFLAKTFYGAPLLHCHIIDFMTVLKDQIYSKGIQETDYQSIIFSLKLFEILLKSLSGDCAQRLNKSTILSFNKHLQEYLIGTDVWNFFSVKHFNDIFNLLMNEYDDIREISSRILIKFYINDIPMSIESLEERCFDFITSTNISKCSNGLHYSRLYVHNQKSTIDSIKDLKMKLLTKLRANYIDFLEDPLKCSRSGQHLYGFLNCLNEIFQCTNTSTDAPDILSLTNEINDSMLKLLNLPDDGTNFTPDFEIMDQSLNILVEKSTKRGDNDQDDRKYLLLSIWLTLKVKFNLNLLTL